MLAKENVEFCGFFFSVLSVCVVAVGVFAENNVKNAVETVMRQP